MPWLKEKLLQEHLLVFMFCLAVIMGPALTVLFEYNLTYFPDCKTYLGLAQFNFDQNPVRAFRVIVPFAATALNFLFGGIFQKMAPAYFIGNYSFPFSFFIVNTLLIAYFGVLVYRYCKSFGADRLAAIMGTLAVLTCRYTAYLAALPLVDSLFCVVIMLTLSGIKERNKSMLLWAIFLGPFAKESFVFVAPLIFFFSHLSKRSSFIYLLCSAILVFSLRFLYELFMLKNSGSGIVADMQHLPNILRYLPKLFSAYTLRKIGMNIGLWVFLPLLVLIVRPQWSRQLMKKLDGWLLWYLLSVVVQMLLSGSMERMFYLAMPVLCVIVALSVVELRQLYLPAGKKPDV